jgi:hypothetical protein
MGVNIMAKFEKTVTLATGQTIHLHTSVATRCSVEIKEGRGFVRMQRVRFAVVADGFTDTNFIFLTAAQCIPVGLINGTLNVAGPITVTYKVRTGRDFTGSPEFGNQ